MDQQNQLDDAYLRRLSWRCRRGMLELDLVLARFVSGGYQQLNAAEQQAFEQLLEVPDTQLWDMIANKQDAISPEQQFLIQKIRSV